MGLFTRILAPQNLDITTSHELDAFLRQQARVWAGVDVTAETAVQVGAVFACVRLIAEDIGKLPFVVYRRDGRRKFRAPESPYWRLLHDKPNPWQTSQGFREYLTASALLRGNGFAFKNQVGGQVRELIPLHPDQVRVEQLEDFSIIYHVRLRTGEWQQFTRREIFHLPGILLNPATGASIITYARQSIGLSMAMERHAATFFGNGQFPGGVFRHPGRLSQQALDNLKESLQEEFSGERAHNVLILEEGMDWTRIGLSNEDSQFLESRQFSVTEIARWFRVQPHKIADLARATFSNIEHQSIENVSDTLLPWAKRWEYEVNLNVIGTNSVFAELLFDAVLRGDTKSRYEAYAIAIQNGWMTRNEVRELENLNPVDGLDEFLVPLNMQPVGGEEGQDATADAAAR